jgi:hypothetical protein
MGLQISIMVKKIDENRYHELLKQKNELENNRPHDITSMRRWKHSMGKILEELELFKK